MDSSMMLDRDPSVPHRPLPGGGAVDHHPMHILNANKGVSPSAAITSDEDDDETGGAGGGHHLPAPVRSKNKGSLASASPWQRMKWTDDVVRLLIATVASVGDDGPEHKPCPGGALQKKGKWKTISKLMLDKGCYVSPQQCEDKFNDLNKRYKRLNEILGWGTTCRVVENPTLLDSMPHISAKAKDDVRKILSSKHLFYREMCAYHNGQRVPACHDLDPVGHVPQVDGLLKEGNANGNVYDNDDGARDDDDDDENDEDDDNADDEERNDGFVKTGFDSFIAEVDGMLRDPMKTPLERREWFKRRALQLQEERMDIQAEAFELEKRWFKWQRFRSKKDRELEWMRLENERLILENEQMAMQVRQREMELEIKLSGETSESGGFRMEVEQGRDHMDLVRVQ